MTNLRRTRPLAEPLEPRALLAVIFDVDTGTAPMAANVSTYPYDFSSGVAGAPEVVYKHGALIARDMLAAGFAGPIVELKASDPSGHYTADAVAAAITWAATSGKALYPHRPIVVAVPLSGAGDPAVPSFVGSLPFFRCERLCARAGIALAVAAGNDGVNTDTTPAYLASTSTFATNVLAVAAARPDGTLQPYSNYGPGTVLAAAITDDATSGAAALGAVALANEADANPPPRHATKAQAARYAHDLVRATVQGTAPDPALAGLVGGGLVMAPGSHTVRLRRSEVAQRRLPISRA